MVQYGLLPCSWNVDRFLAEYGVLTGDLQGMEGSWSDDEVAIDAISGAAKKKATRMDCITAEAIHVIDNGYPKHIRRIFCSLWNSGPLFWNTLYDGIPKMVVPGVRLIAYADDIAVLVSSYSHEGVSRNLATVMRKAKDWLHKKALTHAAEKMEIIQISSLNCPGITQLQVMEHKIKLHSISEKVKMSMVNIIWVLWSVCGKESFE
ncbi:hypothetical protein ANTPLA_LOCUS1921 [Anthophora plagiata]